MNNFCITFLSLFFSSKFYVKCEEICLLIDDDAIGTTKSNVKKLLTSDINGSGRQKQQKKKTRYDATTAFVLRAQFLPSEPDVGVCG